MYDYFYGQQAELFSFYRVPKVLFTDEKFSNISSDAKLLYGIMLDRMNLSAKNGWVDELGRVYIIFTIEEVKGALGCAEKKAVKLLHELENKCGLIERKRIGLGKPNYIYVKNFVDNSVERQFLNCQKDNSGTVNKTLQELSKAQGNNTDIKDTDYSDTDPILSSDFSGRDVEKDEEFQSYYQYFYEELEMDYLFREFPYDKEVLESILEILVETVCSKRKLIRMPSLGMLTVNALAAADNVLIPVQAAYLPAKGLEQLLQTINKVRRQINPKLRIEGILLTMVDSRTNYSKDISNLIRENYGGKLKVYKTDIPRSVRAEEISAEGTSIFKHDPKGKVADAYRVLTKEVLSNAEKRRKHQLEQLR